MINLAYIVSFKKDSWHMCTKIIEKQLWLIYLFFDKKNSRIIRFNTHNLKKLIMPYLKEL